MLFQSTGDGLNSIISFNNKGAPMTAQYDIVNLKQTGWQTVRKLSLM